MSLFRHQTLSRISLVLNNLLLVILQRPLKQMVTVVMSKQDAFPLQVRGEVRRTVERRNLQNRSVFAPYHESLLDPRMTLVALVKAQNCQSFAMKVG